jgi:hypothetical protein
MSYPPKEENKVILAEHGNFNRVDFGNALWLFFVVIRLSY